MAEYAFAIDITADYKRYDRYRDVLIAKGNVVVTGKDFRIESPYVIRSFKDDKIIAMDKFTFEREGYRITGSNLEYSFASVTGNAERIRINFGQTFLGARYMTISPDKFELYDAYFTGCNAPNSDYHISAQQIALYPDTGIIVAYYAACWIWMAPVIPVPTFVYSAPVPKSKFIKRPLKERPSVYAEEKMQEVKPLQPVPEIGANPVDGNFIKQGFNWYFTPRSYAKMYLVYSDRNRGGAGLAANYILNNESEGEIRFGSNEGEGFFWGINHYFSFGEKLISKKDEKWLIYDYYKPGGKYSYELELRQSYRERPNLDQNAGPFTRVSYSPKVTVRSNRKPLPLLGEPFTYFIEASSALVSEEVPERESPIDSGYTLSSQVDNIYADIIYGANWGWLGKFNFIVDSSSSRYGSLTGKFNGVTIESDDFSHWDRAEQKVSLQQEYFKTLVFTYGHNHYIYQDGASPYKYEGYWYSKYDTFSGGITYKFWSSYLATKANYDLPSWDLNNIRYQLMCGMHCYNLVFEYVLKNDIDTYRSEFNFSFELVPSRWQ